MIATATATVVITYRKTKTGQWVAYGPAEALRPGAVVVITKRDGTTKIETIENIGKTFTVDGTAMVYGYLATATVARSGGTRIDMGYGRFRTHPARCGCQDCFDERS